MTGYAMSGHTLKEACRLLLKTKLSNRATGRQLGRSFNSIRRLRQVLKKRRLTWEAIEKLGDKELFDTVYAHRGPARRRAEPDWNDVHEQLKDTDVTLESLWEDYKKVHKKDGYSYAHFTYRYRKFERKLELVMRQRYRPGEYTFVDFAGRTVPWVDAHGIKHQAQVFVGCLAFSNYTFAYAVASQSMPDAVEAMVRMHAFNGGVTEAVGLDNFKAAVSKAGAEPTFTRTFLDLARHYDQVLVASRVRRPRDKAKVEAAVRMVSRWILAKLRKRKFRSLAEINAAIAKLLAELNERPFKRMDGCRRSRFVTLEKPALKALPPTPYEHASWTVPLKVGPDYHVWVRHDGVEHAYSVPYTHAHDRVEARVSGKTVELFHDGQRVAAHVRSAEAGGHTTAHEHLMPAHRAYAERTPEKFVAWAERLGPATAAVVKHQFEKLGARHLIAMKACDGLQRQAREHGEQRLEAACKRAEFIGSMNLTSVKSILRRGLDNRPLEDVPTQGALPLNQNVRGARYYAGEANHAA